MLDVSHLGLGDEPRHYVTVVAVECLDLYQGTGPFYLLETQLNILKKMEILDLRLP